ncbi:MAG: phage tail length tape measure family protein [Pseudomonadota bacterium]
MTLVLAARATLDASGMTSGAQEGRRAVGSLGSAADAAASDIDQLSASQQRAAAITENARRSSQGMATALTQGSRASAQAVGLTSAEMSNLSFQMNDIAMGLATGQSPFTVMIQQGAQVNQILGRRGVGQIFPLMLQGLTSLLTPTTLVLGGITALGFGAAEVFNRIRGEVEDTDAVIERHEDLIRRIKDAYAEAGEGAQAYARESQAVLEADLRRNRETLSSQLANQSQGLLDFLARRDLQALGTATDVFAQTTAAVEAFQQSVSAGTPDVLALVETIARISEETEGVTNSQRGFFDRLRDVAGAAVETQRALEAASGTVEEIGEDSERASRSLDQFARALQRINDANRTITPQERANRSLREALDAATTIEQIERAYAAHQENLARIQNQDRGLGIPNPIARPADLSLDRPVEDLLRSQAEELRMLQLEAQLLGASSAERARRLALMEAENQIRRLNIDGASAEANAIRANAAAIAEGNSALDRQREAWESVRDAGTDAIDRIFGAIDDGDIEGALEGIAREISNFLIELGAKNPLKNALFGTDLPTLEDAGGLGGIIRSLLGGGPQGPGLGVDIASSPIATGMMSVNATSVIINGGGLGAIGSLVGANDNGGVAAAVSGGGVPNPIGRPIALGGGTSIGRVQNLVSDAGRGLHPFLDLIARAEGTAGPNAYNTSLGYGLLTGGEQNLVGMTLNQIDQLQTRMLAHPANQWNSSALGRYQIVRTTRRGLQEQMGLTGNELFSPELQDQMALRLMMGRGNDVGELREEWQGLLGVDAETIRSTFNAQPITDAIEELGSSATQTGNLLSNMGTDVSGLAEVLAGSGKSLLSSTQTLSVTAEGFSGQSKQLADSLASGLQDISSSIGQAGAPGTSGGGGFLSSIFSAGLNLLGGLFGYRRGGDTGRGNDDDVTGFVHANEFVFNARATRRIGVRNLEALHDGAMRGYREGGFVVGGGVSGGYGRPVLEAASNGPQIAIYNFSGAPVREEQESDGRGGRRTKIVIGEAVGGAIADTGGPTQRAMRGTFGIRPQRVRR